MEDMGKDVNRPLDAEILPEDFEEKVTGGVEDNYPEFGFNTVAINSIRINTTFL